MGPAKWDRPSGIVSSERVAGAGAFLSLPMQVFDYWNDPWGHTLESVFLVLTPTASIAPNVSPLSRTCDRAAHAALVCRLSSVPADVFHGSMPVLAVVFFSSVLASSSG